MRSNWRNYLFPFVYLYRITITECFFLFVSITYSSPLFLFSVLKTNKNISVFSTHLLLSENLFHCSSNGLACVWLSMLKFQLSIYLYRRTQRKRRKTLSFSHLVLYCFALARSLSFSLVVRMGQPTLVGFLWLATANSCVRLLRTQLQSVWVCVCVCACVRCTRELFCANSYRNLVSTNRVRESLCVWRAIGHVFWLSITSAAKPIPKIGRERERWTRLYKSQIIDDKYCRCCLCFAYNHKQK